MIWCQRRVGELAPRTRALVQKKEAPQQAKVETQEGLRLSNHRACQPRAAARVRAGLKPLVEESSIIEQKAFLKPFVERIQVDDSEMKVIHTIPMPPDNRSAETVGVLPFVHSGPPQR